MRVYGPVHRSWVSFTWTQSLCSAESAPFTKPKSSCFTRVQVEVRRIPAVWCSRRMRLCSWRCCRSLRAFFTSRRFSLLSARRLCSPSMPSSTGLGEVAYIWVRQSRPNGKRKGAALPGSRAQGLSGAAGGSAAGIHPTAEANSCKVPRGSPGSTPLTSRQLLEPLGGR